MFKKSAVFERENKQVPAKCLKKAFFGRLHQMTKLYDDVKKWNFWTG